MSSPPSTAGGSGALPSGRPHASGFTLAEVLLVLGVTGIVLSAALWMFMRGARFYERSAEAITARQNLRAAIDLLAAEIRQASAADFLAADADSVAVRFDVSRSGGCDSTAQDEVALLMFDTVRAPNLPSTFRGTAVSDPYHEGFSYLDGWRASVRRKGAIPAAACEARGGPVDLPPARYRLIDGWRERYGRLPRTGSLVRSYGRLGYRLAPSAFGPGLALWRNGQELAAPFAAASGFTYLLSSGEERESVSPAALGEIRAVRIRLIATGPSGGARFQPPVRIHGEHVVYLRN